MVLRRLVGGWFEDGGWVRCVIAHVKSWSIWLGEPIVTVDSWRRWRRWVELGRGGVGGHSVPLFSLGYFRTQGMSVSLCTPGR